MFAIPGAALALGSILSAEVDRSAPKPTPITLEVSKSEMVDARSISLELVWSDGTAVRSPGLNGLVTALAVAPGTTLKTGSRVLSVDGVWRMAARTDAPFYGIVDDTGAPPQIAALNGLLARLGLPHADGDRWSWATVRGIRALAASLGVPDASARSALDASWLIWIPVDPFVVGSTKTGVGYPAPAAGEPILEGRPRLSSAKVVEEESDPLPSGADGDAAWRIAVGDVSVPYSPAGLLDAAAIASLSGALDGSRPEKVAGVLQRAEPVTAWEVPASAVLVDGRGHRCVFADVSGPKHRAYAVRLVGGAFGVTRVTGPLPDRFRLLANPVDVIEHPSCG